MDRSTAASVRAATLAVALVLSLPMAASGTASTTPIADPGAVLAAPTDARIALRQVAGGLSQPVFVTSARDGTGRMFIVEKTGRIKILKDGNVLATPFLSLAGSVSTGGEQGLLGLAFHPGFATNRKLYVSYTNLAGHSVIREYRASTGNPDRVDTSTARKVLKIRQPYANHNGGMIAFGPDGYLYIGMGDGGSAGDPGNRAQDVDSLLGKMLRINVNGKTSTRGYLIPSSNPYVGRAGRNEIWQRGLRNPWRFAFDRANGNLWIGDVGQARYEEVNRARRTSTGAGRGFNWGWRVMEGRHCYRPSSGCNTSGKKLPIVEYAHSSTRCSVTGGYVYRGSDIPALRGGYVFGDFCSGTIWVIDAAASSPATKVRLLGTSLLLSSFGEGADGELYVCDMASGKVYRIVQG